MCAAVGDVSSFRQPLACFACQILLREQRCDMLHRDEAWLPPAVMEPMCAPAVSMLDARQSVSRIVM